MPLCVSHVCADHIPVLVPDSGSDTWNYILYNLRAAHKRIVSSSAAQARTPFHPRVYQLPTLPFPSVSMANFARPFPDPGNGLLLGDIFSGIGGWELAANSEWECVFAAEVEPHARKVWEANHGRQPDVGDILEFSPSSTKFAHVFCISFPCQSSSQAGQRLGRADPRGGKVLERALDMVDAARPPLVVFENVKGFKTVQEGSYYTWLEDRLRSIGYPSIRSAVLSTHHYGIPQKRERLYLVAFREDCAHFADDFDFPAGNEQMTPTAGRLRLQKLRPAVSSALDLARARGKAPSGTGEPSSASHLRNGSESCGSGPTRICWYISCSKGLPHTISRQSSAMPHTSAHGRRSTSRLPPSISFACSGGRYHGAVRPPVPCRWDTLGVCQHVGRSSEAAISFQPLAKRIKWRAEWLASTQPPRWRSASVPKRERIVCRISAADGCEPASSSRVHWPSSITR